MSKLKLDLDALDVDSFIVSERDGGRGTVQGQDSFFTLCHTCSSPQYPSEHRTDCTACPPDNDG